MTDLRIKRTETAIQTTFVKLVNENGFESVTVTKIAEEAMINRLTFYKHYTDKYALAQTMIENFGQIYEQVIKKRLELSRENQSFKDILEVMTPELNTLFVNRQDELKALQSIQVGALTLNKRLEKIIGEYMPKIMKHEVPPFEKALLVALLVNIFNYVIEEQHVPDYRELQQMLTDVQSII